MSIGKVIDRVGKLALGTVQLGLAYGISNSKGQVSESEAQAILDCARRSGLTTWDTARGYGTSEQVIGRNLARKHSSLSLVSKIPRLGQKPDVDVESEIAHHLLGTLETLNVDSIETLLLHHEADLAGNSGDAVWRSLEGFRKQGKVRKIGVSSYSPDLLKSLLSRFPIEVIQVPYNLLDSRFFSAELKASYARSGVEVHVRSVFLQGLFFMQPEALSETMGFAASTLRQLNEIAKALGVSLPELAVGQALMNPDISKVVIGVTSVKELEEVLSWDLIQLTADQAQKLESLREAANPRIIDPREWVRKS